MTIIGAEWPLTVFVAVGSSSRAVFTFAVNIVAAAEHTVYLFFLVLFAPLRMLNGIPFDSGT